MKNFKLLLFFVLILAVKACDNNNSLNTKLLKEELDSRKIKRISEARILETAFAKGRKLVDTIQVLGKKQPSAQSDTLNKSYRLGSLQPSVDILQQSNKAEIKKIIANDLTSTSIKDLEREIFEAYQYNIAQGLKVEDNVQVLDRHIFYAAPILEEGELRGIWSIYFDKPELIKTID